MHNSVAYRISEYGIAYLFSPAGDIEYIHYTCHLLCIEAGVTITFIAWCSVSAAVLFNFSGQTVQLRRRGCSVLSDDTVQLVRPRCLTLSAVFSFRNSNQSVFSSICFFIFASAVYVKDIFRRLRDHGYDENTMTLYITGGGGCLVKNFSKVNADRIKFVDDICAAAKGYEYLAEAQIKSEAKV